MAEFRLRLTSGNTQPVPRAGRALSSRQPSNLDCIKSTTRIFKTQKSHRATYTPTGKRSYEMKTYLLAPNFTFEPDGPIRIGIIIADPFHPTKSLHIPTTKPAVAKHTDLDVTHARQKSRSHHHSIWAQFFSTASANIRAGASSDVHTQYTMNSLETIRMKEDPTDKDAAELLNIPEIKATVSAGLMGFAPVYMITGIKIARGFRLSTRTSQTHDAQLGGSVPITDTLGAGGEMSGSRRVVVEDSLHSGSDIIFAYQLHVVAPKRWWRRLENNVYTPSAAFLSENEESGREGEATARSATVELLMRAAEEEENDTVKESEVIDNDSVCECLLFQM